MDLYKPLPTGPFDVIVADPPWLYQKNPGSKGAVKSASGTVDLHYPTMTNEQLIDLPVRDVAASHAHLFMWFTNPGTFGGRFSSLTPADIAKAWGFEFRTVLTWVKTTKTGEPTRGGMGWYFRGATEHVLYATRGKASIPAHLREGNVILAPRTRHSAKPEEFTSMVERVTTGRRLELFARSTREGWSSWGNEVEGAA
ncbi:methyltransferase [Curtobacterium sp. Csp2]|uniref:MT-A70 family methyltransferase n=1 Tax=Curtobacterium sp. Csp2 TaxID=2495430 RepID=UPI00157FCEAB|nr:MT-A70 family methyltransferase [Curtobacterium sp. Csp2]QKS15726.1 methyltransferase [Curtobacterium sp. Csp2]